MKKEIQVAHIHLETNLRLTEEFVQLLIVENPTEFYNMVSDLDRQFDGQEGLFVFSTDEGIISASKRGAIVSDWFHFELNDKKITTLLYKRLENIALGEKLVRLNDLNTQIMGFLGEIAFGFPFSLEYNEPQPTDYFKVAGLKFENHYETLEEKIVCYINALIELKGCEFFVFVNLKSVLSDEKLLQMYEHCQREQVGLLLIESQKQRSLLSNEKAVIITEDLCEILENYEEM